MNEQKFNILVVDDRPENLIVMEGILSSPRFNIFKANSGAEALGLMLDYEFAIVLLDVQMPELDGFETVELMKKSEKTKNIPIIFVTAINYDKKSITRGYDVGAVDYLFKPIDPVVLKSKVDVFINLYEQKEIIKMQAHALDEKVKELLELKESNWHLENLTLVDELTGMQNRRSFNQHINIQWGNCAFARSPLSVLMIDIDKFKSYNDNYGHMSGDQVIVQVAKTIMESLSRPLDIAFRYGGEEFIVLLPNTDIIGAKSIGERIRKNIESLNIEHTYSEPKEIITVSVGATQVVPDYKFLYHELVENADKALYIAKNQGRNIVMSL